MVSSVFFFFFGFLFFQKRVGSHRLVHRASSWDGDNFQDVAMVTPPWAEQVSDASSLSSGDSWANLFSYFLWFSVVFGEGLVELDPACLRFRVPSFSVSCLLVNYHTWVPDESSFRGESGRPHCLSLSSDSLICARVVFWVDECCGRGCRIGIGSVSK